MPRDLLAPQTRQPRDLLAPQQRQPTAADREAFAAGIPNIDRDIEQMMQAGTMQQPRQPRTFTEKVMRDLGIFRDVGSGMVRGAAQGATDIVAPFANAMNWTANQVMPGNPLSIDVNASLGQVMTDAGIPEPQTEAGRSLGTVARGSVGMAGGSAMANRIFPYAAPGAQPRVTPRQQVFNEGRQAGLVAPPASVRPNSIPGMLEGAAGKIKTGQLASARNQTVINRMAAQAVGVTDEALTPQALDYVRQQAGDAYRVIRSAGNIVTDDDFRNTVANAVREIRSAASQSQTLAQQSSGVLGIADDLAKESFDADTAVNLIRLLRDRASAAYRTGSATEGGAFRSMAGALEDVIERNLSARGGEGTRILDAFRQARTLIAKTHTIEDAMRGSQVSANALANMLQRGKPLTDELATIARFAQEFPSATRVPQFAGSIPAYSPLDVWTGAASVAGGVATGRPSLLLPALYSLGRPGLRNFLLSRPGQRMLTGAGSGISANVLGAGVAPANALMD